MRENTKRKKGKSVSQLKKLADKVFSIYIRLKASKGGVYAKCYTCGARKKVSELQAGHFISRGNNAVRYDEMNARPQCVACNIFKHGNIAIFAANLLEEYGEEKFKELMERGKQTHQFTISELKNIIEYYKEKLK